MENEITENPVIDESSTTGQTNQDVPEDSTSQTTATVETPENPYLADTFTGYAEVPIHMILILILGVLMLQLILGRKIL